MALWSSGHAKDRRLVTDAVEHGHRASRLAGAPIRTGPWFTVRRAATGTAARASICCEDSRPLNMH